MLAEPPRASTAPAATPFCATPGLSLGPLRAALFLFVAAIVLCVFCYLALSIPGSWFPPATQEAWTVRSLAITRGEGTRIADDLSITAADATGAAIVSTNTDFNSADYPIIAWVASDLADNAEVALLWRTDHASFRLNTAQLTVASGRLLPVSLATNPAWVGRIKGLALLIRGPLEQPARIHGVMAKSMGALHLLTDRAREWLAFEPWSGTSINTIAGGADEQDLPLTTLLAVAITLSSAAWYGFARGRREAVSLLPAVIAILFVLAWGVLDARWMLNLGRQVIKTAAQYQGKNWRERSLAADDGPLYAFIEKARAKMPATPARVFMVADATYFRGRGAYHLYPHNVYYDPWRNSMPQSSSLRQGDFLIVYNRTGVQFDPEQQRVRWEGDAPIAAEALLVEPDSALFRIR